MNDTKYFYHEIPLSQERVKHANSKLAPWIMDGIKMDFLTILSLDGTAEISIDRGDFFPLAQKMRLYLGGKQKRIEIINSSQPDKWLKLLISRKSELEVVK